jgi:prefoldin subunit 5
VLRDRRLPAINRPTTRWATLIVAVLLAALPAAAQARNYKIEGVVTGPPAARGGAVTVPFKVTPQVGRALNFGTRNVSVRIARRARLRLSGAGASGVSRLSPSGLRAGDRLKGVTSISRRARRRLRWSYRPALKVKRATVIRPAPRALAPPSARGGGPGTFPLPAFSGIPGPPATPLGQVVAHLSAQTSALSARADEAGPLAQRIEAQGLRLDELKETGIGGVTTAFDSLQTALADLEGQVGVDQAALDALQLEVEELRGRVEQLEGGIGPIDSTLGELKGALSKVRGAAEKLVPAVGNMAAQVASIQQTAGAQAVVTSLDAAATNLNGRLDTVEAGLGSLASDTAALIEAMASLAASVNQLASADFAGMSAGVSDLGPAVAALEAGFGGLTATSNALVPVADAIETEAPELEKAVGELCSLVPTTCP